MRAGISRVAVEVILLVLAVALALLIFSPVGSFIFSALGRTQLTGGATTLEVISVKVDDTSHYITIAMKNQGPSDLKSCGDVGNWTVVVKSQNGEETYTGTELQMGQSDDDFNVGETWEITVAQNTGLTSTDTFTVIVYGPQGTRGEYIYRP